MIGKRYIIYAVVALLLFPLAMSAKGPVSIKASLDSAYILMGKQTLLKVDVVEDDDIDGHFLNHAGDTITGNVEIIKNLAPDTTDLGSGRREIRRELVIQSFDSGLYTLPPFVYVSGNDTFASNALVLKVIPVPVDTLKTIHDYEGVVKPATKIWDYIPDFIVDYWWIYLAVIIVAVAVLIWFVYFRGKKSLPLVPKKKPVPPYEAAMLELNKLKNEKLCESGHEKEYYTRLTEILRIYLDRRFGINAMEMTSTQILDRIKTNSEAKPSAPIMRQILEMADFVKFAKVRPLPDDNVKAFNNAVKFVEDTKPVEPETDPAAESQQSTDKNDN